MADMTIYIAETFLELLGSLCIALVGLKSLKKDKNYRITQSFATGLFLLCFTFLLGLFIVLDSLDDISFSTLYFNILRALAILCLYLSGFFLVLT